MNARSALETVGVLVVGAFFGAAIIWFYLDGHAKAEANKTLSAELQTVKDAAPAIAQQVQSLQRAAQTTRSLNEAFAAQNERLAPLADCTVPDDLWRLSIQRTQAINAHARSGDSGAAEANVSEGRGH